MDKEELEKEATEISKKAFCVAHTHEDELIYRNGYLAGAEPREKQIAELKEQLRIATDYPEWSKVVKLSQEDCIVEVVNLRKENAELKRDKEDLIFIRNQNAKCMCEDKENLAKAKKIIKRMIKVTWGEGWNYSLDVKVAAEQFLKEMEK